jgi:hypothetical protein
MYAGSLRHDSDFEEKILHNIMYLQSYGDQGRYSSQVNG